MYVPPKVAHHKSSLSYESQNGAANHTTMNNSGLCEVKLPTLFGPGINLELFRFRYRTGPTLRLATLPENIFR